jgi:molybdopterin-guanine dinucleotide biosynthesis protein A
MDHFDAIVLAGGAATRLGGVAKPSVEVSGRRMLDWVLSAVEDARSIVVVGPPDLDVPPAVRRVQEEPPGGGPAAAIGAAMARAAAAAVDSAQAGHTIIVAGDLPLLRPDAIRALVRAATEPGRDGAVFVDADLRPQWLCGAWRTTAIRDRLDALTGLRGTLANASLRALLEPLRFARIRLDDGGMPPFYDCDTQEDIRRVEEWLAR